MWAFSWTRQPYNEHVSPWPLHSKHGLLPCRRCMAAARGGHPHLPEPTPHTNQLQQKKIHCLCTLFCLRRRAPEHLSVIGLVTLLSHYWHILPSQSASPARCVTNLGEPVKWTWNDWIISNDPKWNYLNERIMTGAPDGHPLCVHIY